MLKVQAFFFLSQCLYRLKIYLLVDIFDGDQEPMVFHGKSFTSKVSLREVCEAILKYGFVASPYPIIISAEIHCSIGQQDLIAAIMMQVFGDKLVKMPTTTTMDGEEVRESEKGGLVEGLVVMKNNKKVEIEELPSPEQLKGRILLKVSFFLGMDLFFFLMFFFRPRIWSWSKLILWILKVIIRIRLLLRRIRIMLSTSQKLLTKVTFILLYCF